MTQLTQPHRNGALWAGGIITLLAVLSQGLYFLNLPGQSVFPYINLLLAAVGVIFFAVGLRRAFKQPSVYRGKTGGSIFGALSLILFGLGIFLFIHARAMPASANAPKVGQKAPEFTLADTSGQQLSLKQLLSTPGQKGVLLVFYRGYW